MGTYGPMSNCPNGITSFGIPVIPTGVPFGRNSKVFFVDPVNGADGNQGTNKDYPFKTLTQALSVCVSNRGDTVFLFGSTAASSSLYLSANLDWNKSGVNLVGMCADSVNPRARIANASTVTTLPVMFTVSGSNCTFSNLSFFNGYAVAEAQNAVTVTGSRNVFHNCRISGIGAVLTADVTASTSLKITGGSENKFSGCYIGLDTVPRAAANAEVVFAGNAARNLFEGCTFESICSSAGAAHVFVSAGASSLDRYAMFKNCAFINSVGSAGTAMTAAFTVNAAAGGLVVIDPTTFVVGCTNWIAASSTKMVIAGAVPNATTSGVALSAVV